MQNAPSSHSLKVAGLFAGIGGIELGLHAAGHQSVFLCELDDGAQRVLRAQFPGVTLVSDVRNIDELPPVDVVAAGFPCQDLSQAGGTAGIRGQHSGLVEEVFRLVTDSRRAPRWLVLENVPFMLQLDRGTAMHYLTNRLSELGFMWAYRVLDTRAFGLPQRRKRVLLLASRTDDPREILLHGNEAEADFAYSSEVACGFYWTEGIRGLGWAVDAVPTLKGGSTIGIPSPPAMRLPDRSITTPDLRDAERLQGFPADWTAPAVAANVGGRLGHRWKLVGNAVSVPLAHWIGKRLLDPQPFSGRGMDIAGSGSSWPIAAWGRNGELRAVELSQWPVRDPYDHLADFLQFPPKPLSEKAARGFLSRTARSSLRFPEGLLEDVAAHIEAVRTQQVLVA